MKKQQFQLSGFEPVLLMMLAIMLIIPSPPNYSTNRFPSTVHMGSR